MGSVLKDRRVTERRGGRYDVKARGTTYHVIRTPGDVFGWAICHGPNLDYVPAQGGGFAFGYPDAETAVGDVLSQ